MSADRATSFGEVADAYERWRPAYPGAALAAVVAEVGPAVPRTAVDIGCGTGILARQITALGFAVVGVEPDRRMAALARRRGLAVHEGRFEDWAADDASIGLAVAGQSWHWVDPVTGRSRAAAVLAPGGVLALLWNQLVDTRPATVVPAVIAHLEAEGLGGDAGSSLLRPPEERDDAAHLAADPRFTRVTASVVPWARQMTPEGYVGLLLTRSSLLTAGGDREEVGRALRRLVAAEAGSVTLAYRSDIVTARRTGDAGLRCRGSQGSVELSEIDISSEVEAPVGDRLCPPAELVGVDPTSTPRR